ncbi:MAG: hypothetical protein ACYSYL_01410 [Planctomycetota bacterium]|jgi:hypothetical protein
MVKRSFEKNGDTGICVAEGLALRALAPEKTVGVNFLEADNADMKPALDLRKELIISAALVAAIIVVSFVGKRNQTSFPTYTAGRDKYRKPTCPIRTTIGIFSKG